MSKYFFYNCKSIKFEDYVIFFLDFFFYKFLYDINNINTVFTPLTSSLRWVQEKYLYLIWSMMGQNLY